METNQQNQDEIEIDLLELLRVLWSKIGYVILAALALGHRRRQKQVGSAAAHNSEGELVLKFPVQGAGGVLRHQIQLLRFFKCCGCGG